MTFSTKRFLSLTSFITMLVAVFLSAQAYAVMPPVVTGTSRITAGISAPVRVAVDNTGTMYVTDPRGGGVLKYSAQGTQLGIIRTAQPPQGIAVRGDGSLVVSEGNFVAILDPSGNELRKLGSGIGQFRMANGITLDTAGSIFVVDSLDNAVKIFDAAGNYVSSFGSAGVSSGMFSSPTAIAFEKTSNTLAVADTINGRIQFFDTTGLYLKTIGVAGSGPMQFTAPMGITFEYSKDLVPSLLRMYVADAFQSNIQVIDPAAGGTFLSFIGSYGTAPGQLIAPADVAFDPVGSRIAVVNGFGDLTLFGIDTGPGSVPVPPQLTVNAVPATVATPNLTISGTLSAGAVVSATVNTGATASATSYPSSTTWSIMLAGLKDGANTVTITATGTNGLKTIQTIIVKLVVTPLSLTMDPVPAVTRLSTQTISGTVDAGATVNVAVNTTATVGPVTRPSATAWQATLSGLVNGDNVISVTATNGSGSTGVVTAKITVDTAAPVLVVSCLPNGSITSGQVQNISGTVADAHFDKVTLNGHQVAVTNGSFSAPVVLLSGPNTIDVSASDLVGNVTTNSRTIIFESANAAATVTTPADGSSTRNGVLQLAGAAPVAGTVFVNGAAALINGANWSASVNLTPGINTIVIESRLLAGVSSFQKRTVVYDTAAPEFAVTSPAQDSAANTRSLSLSGAVTPGSTVTCTVNGVQVQAIVSGSTFGCTAPVQTDGSYALIATASEPGGATSVTTRTVVVDTVPPTLLITPPASPAPTSLSGTITPGFTISAADKNGPAGVVTMNGSTWNVDLNGMAYDPATLTVSAVDAAGNRAWRSLSFTGPDGDLSGDGAITVADALKALRIVIGAATPSVNDYLHGDVGVIRNNRPQPKGTIEMLDAIMILRKAVGLESY